MRVVNTKNERLPFLPNRAFKAISALGGLKNELAILNARGRLPKEATIKNNLRKVDVGKT
jgi:hypothetical protein